jgi:hypothetical protein
MPTKAVLKRMYFIWMGYMSKLCFLFLCYFVHCLSLILGDFSKAVKSYQLVIGLVECG